MSRDHRSSHPRDGAPPTPPPAGAQKSATPLLPSPVVRKMFLPRKLSYYGLLSPLLGVSLLPLPSPPQGST